MAQRHEASRVVKRAHPKVAAGGAAGALSVVLVYEARRFGVEIAPEEASALTMLLSLLAASLRRDA